MVVEALRLGNRWVRGEPKEEACHDPHLREAATHSRRPLCCQARTPMQATCNNLSRPV